MSLPLAVTQGDPLGIGPEIILKALAAMSPDAEQPLVLGEPSVFDAASRACGLPAPRRLLAAPCDGQHAALWALEEACRLAREGAVDGIVTAPVHKSDLTRAGFRHPGQTEFLGDRLGTDRPTMLLAGPVLRVALVTTHLPLSRVPAAVTKDAVERAVMRLDEGLRAVWGIASPRIAVLGLNPHAGEHGLFGNEDVDVVLPAVEACRSSGVDAAGPLPGDGTFAPRARAAFDGFVAMYHDQGLAALKAVDGGSAVNITLGLPVPRTSPDHGTARDIAGLGVADAASMIAAIGLASSWAARRAGGRRIAGSGLA